MLPAHLRTAGGPGGRRRGGDGGAVLVTPSLADTGRGAGAPRLPLGGGAGGRDLPQLHPHQRLQATG